MHSVIFMAISHLINSRWKKLHFVIELKKMNFEHVHRLHFFFAFSKAIDYQELSFPLRNCVNADWNRAKETIYLNEHQMTYLEWLWVRFCFFLDASYYCAFERSVTFILAESQKFILFPSEELLHFTRFILISTRFSNFVEKVCCALHFQISRFFFIANNSLDTLELFFGNFFLSSISRCCY